MNQKNWLMNGFVAGAVAAWLALPCAAELVYYLPFDNGSSATLTNYGSAGGAATAVTVSSVTPTASADVYANLGGAYCENFPMSANGDQGGRVDFPSSTNKLRLATNGDELTIALWIKWVGPDKRSEATQGIVSTLPGSLNTGWAFTIDGTGALGVNIGGVGGRTTVAPIPSNTWTHIAMTWKSQNPWDDTLKFYTNGLPVGYNLGGFGPANVVSNSEVIRLGNLPGTWFPVNGKLDDVGLWSHRLNAGKLRSLVTAPAVVPGFNLGIMNQLFTLYDAGSGTTVITNGVKLQTWSCATNLTSHVAGDAWMNNTGGVFIQFGTNTGVKYLPRGTMVCIY